MKWKETLFSKQCGKAELLALLLYAAGTFCIMLFHEPWLDEAQAWQIARCASFREILIEIPHYEGHPPLWHLLLTIPAKLGLPYEMSNHVMNLLLTVPAIAVLLYRSPFPKIIRCLLPFTFPLFYQLGVINRPYSLMMLAIFLSASQYRERNTHPMRFILALCLLCLTSAYGVLMAGGICLAWTVEIFRSYCASRKWRDIPRDARFWCLMGILLLALGLLWMCLPAEDIYTSTQNHTYKERLVLIEYAVMMPFDGLFGMIISEGLGLMTGPGILLTLFGGILAWTVMLLLAHANKKLLLLLGSYGSFCLFFALVYGFVHHVAISVLGQLCFFWMLLDDGTFVTPTLFKRISNAVGTPMVRRLAVFTACLACCMPLYCAAVSSYLEIRHPYGPRELADFLHENHLEERRIMNGCPIVYVKEDGTQEDVPDAMETLSRTNTLWDETLPAKMPEVDYMRPDCQYSTTAIQPYFDENPIVNYNVGAPGKNYLLWRDEQEHWEEVLAQWHDEGLPEVCIGLVPLQYIFSEEELDGVEYYWVGTVHYGNIWRLDWDRTPLMIYLRSDLMEEYPQFKQLHYAYNDDY
ncbi:MAG: hypothetical protein IJ055_00515 [Oscillospiraceae bacterium]|nr:hypothetical protein [Oscillospiraceae bacterium]